MTIMRPLSGLTANWMLVPPVSTPISRMIGEGGVAHPLVFLVGQRLGRGDGDRVAGVDAHRVEVLDGADDDDVVGPVAHHLQLEFLPADDRFLDEHLADGAEIEAAGDELVEFLAVVGDAAAGAAQGEAGPEHAGQADLSRMSWASASDRATPLLRHVQADLDHRLLELLRGPRPCRWRRRVAPIISTPNFSSTPCLCRSMAVLRPVWPPSVGSRASGRSFSMILATTSQVIGSM